MLMLLMLLLLLIVIVIQCRHRLSYFVVVIAATARFIVTPPTLPLQWQVQVIAYCMSITRKLALVFCMIWVQFKNQRQRANYYLTE